MTRRNLPMDSACMCSGDQNCFVLVGREGQFVFKSEPSLCYAVNEYFYQLIIQLPLDV